MNVCGKWCRGVVAVMLLAGSGVSPARVQAQDRHVVPVQDLNRDAARPAETRQANQAALRQIFSSQEAQQALKSAHIDYSEVDKAVGQLTDEDAAKLAARSRQLQEDFAAGRSSLSDRDLLIIIIIAVLVIALVAVLH